MYMYGKVMIDNNWHTIWKYDSPQKYILQQNDLDVKNGAHIHRDCTIL